MCRNLFGHHTDLRDALRAKFRANSGSCGRTVSKSSSSAAAPAPDHSAAAAARVACPQSGTSLVGVNQRSRKRVAVWKPAPVLHKLQGCKYAFYHPGDDGEAIQVTLIGMAE